MVRRVPIDLPGRRWRSSPATGSTSPIRQSKQRVSWSASGTRPHGFGVTALDLEDALGIIHTEFFDRHDLGMPPVQEVVENVDEGDVQAAQELRA